MMIKLADLLPNAIEAVNSICPLPDESMDKLMAHVKVKTFSKKEIILEKGKVADKVWFLISGISISYFYREDKKAITWIMPEGKTITNMRSFVTQKPSREYIEAVEDCVCLEIHRDKLYELYESDFHIHKFSRVLTETYYIQHDDHVFHRAFADAETKFQTFVKTYPGAMERMKLRDVASYLGINNATLSRIRSKH